MGQAHYLVDALQSTCVNKHLPCKCWDVVGALHPFLYVSGQPLHLSVRLPPLLLLRALDTCLLFCSFSFWVVDTCALCLLMEAPMLVCVPSDLLHSGSLSSLCSLVLTLCFLVVSTVGICSSSSSRKISGLLMHTPLLYLHCVLALSGGNGTPNTCSRPPVAKP
jgi:hypothetical protein